MQDTANIYSETPDNDTMGGRLLRARDTMGLTIEDIAARMGVRRSTIQSWENDRAQPRANKLQTLAGLLGVSLSWLLHGVGAGPMEDDAELRAEGMAINLARLRRIQQETEDLALRIEDDMRRFQARMV